MYIPNPQSYSDMFAIPTSVLDISLQDVSLDSLKAILWIYKHSGEVISIDALSNALKCSADTALSALDFWVKKGVLSFTDDSGNVKFILKSHKSQKENNPSNPNDSKVLTSFPNQKELPTITFSKPTMEQISARMNEDAEVVSLFTEAQSILGRTFGVDLQGTLLTFLDTYGLPKEVILTLLQHLTEIGKSSNSNIARIGKLWAEKEISTITDANEYIQNDNEIQKLYTKLRIETGFHATSPSTKQAEILKGWIEQHFSFDMMLDAYEESVERNIKYPIPYMDKILKNWHENGFTSKEEYKKSQQNQSKTSQNSRNKKSSFNLDEAVRKATFSAKKKDE